MKKSIGGKLEKVPESLRVWCEKEGNCETWPQIDGVKTLCMDRIYKNAISGSCLLYSFGLADDWSFETIMAGLGCIVSINLIWYY